MLHSSLQATESIDCAAPGSPSWSPVLTLQLEVKRKKSVAHALNKAAVFNTVDSIGLFWGFEDAFQPFIQPIFLALCGIITLYPNGCVQTPF